MKWLIIGDIHGNLPSLEELLQIEKGNYDKLVCHGDVVNYGPWSNECVQLLNSVEESICLKGNHEIAFINGKYEGSHPLVHEFFNICFSSFHEQKLISEYKDSLSLSNYKIVHTILEKYIFIDTPLNESEIQENYIIGHSHKQFIRSINSFDIINTGSLGQNRTYINLSEYLIFDDETKKLEFKHFIYDVDILINQMKAKLYSNNCIDYYRNKKRVF